MTEDNSRKDRNIMIIEVTVLAIITATIFLVGAATTTSGSGQKNTFVLYSGSIVINEGSSNSKEFSVPQGATNVRIQGSFAAAGGSTNNIKVYVMSSNDYAKWQEGHSANTYYSSGLETTGLIDATLSPGVSYYIVFDNTYTILESKTVYATITLTYFD